MPTEATTSANDVRRYVETDLSDSEITDYIDDAERMALRYNALEDFHDGELDDLVLFFSAHLIAKVADQEGGDARQFQQGGRQVTLTTPGENGRRWLALKVRANDPSGKVLGGRAGIRHVTFSGSGGE